MPRAFVIGGYFTRGGTYMAYHIGRIMQRRFGFDAVMVQLGDESFSNSVFDFPDRYEMVTQEQMERLVERDDFLITNPSFSHLNFGFRLPCRKLSFVQHWNTFKVLDGFYDHYVSVSGVVRDFLKMVYGLQTPVINSFIHLEKMPAATPWPDRDPELIVSYGKQFFPQLVSRFQQRMRRRHPHIHFRLNKLGRDNVPHGRLLARLASSRYFLALSPAEGFGLPPLEAMACGCTVTGFDAGGGRDFMNPGVNCLVSCYPALDEVIDQTARVMTDHDLAQGLAAQAALDAGNYGYEQFERRWVDYLQNAAGLERTS